VGTIKRIETIYSVGSKHEALLTKDSLVVSHPSIKTALEYKNIAWVRVTDRYCIIKLRNSQGLSLFPSKHINSSSLQLMQKAGVDIRNTAGDMWRSWSLSSWVELALLYVVLVGALAWVIANKVYIA